MQWEYNGNTMDHGIWRRYYVRGMDCPPKQTMNEPNSWIIQIPLSPESESYSHGSLRNSYSCCAITIDNLNTSKHHPDFDGADIFDIFHLPIVKYQACFDFLLLTRCPICQQCIYHPLSVETYSKHAPREDKNIWILYTSVFVDICRHFPPQGPRDVER